MCAPLLTSNCVHHYSPAVVRTITHQYLCAPLLTSTCVHHYSPALAFTITHQHLRAPLLTSTCVHHYSPALACTITHQHLHAPLFTSTCVHHYSPALVCTITHYYSQVLVIHLPLGHGDVFIQSEVGADPRDGQLDLGAAPQGVAAAGEGGGVLRGAGPSLIN